MNKSKVIIPAVVAVIISAAAVLFGFKFKDRNYY
jgi:hypothetical protein